MQEFNTFFIHKSNFLREKGEIIFHYSFDKQEYFQEKIFLSSEYKIRQDRDENIIQNILFHISLAFGISYYKLFPTKNIRVDSGYLDTYQKKYWKNFYIQGLGEFFYENKIDFRNLCNFESDSGYKQKKIDFHLGENTLLPIGGGKDSIVSALLLEEQKVQNITPFIFGKSDSIKETFLELYGKKALVIQRNIDSKLFEMNQLGYYNGHIPITGLISFFMTLVCYIYNYKYIIFSNEKSANIGNTQLHGQEINHQYSKSENFRNNFKTYISQYISTDIMYTSLLEEYYEIEIAKIFTEKGKKYFSSFSSCNKNFSITQKSNTRWCNTCPKCLFVYIIMRPFLTHNQTLEIFGEELYERKDLEKLFLEIIGFSGIKPFECVGEVEEAQLGSYLSLNKFSSLPYLLKIFKKNIHYSHEYYRDLGNTYFSNK